MEIWQHIVSFTDRNAAKVTVEQWNNNYLEVLGSKCEVPEKLDDLCKRVPKLKIETHTRYVKPRAKSKLGINFKYVPPSKPRRPVKLNKKTVVSVKVVMPKANNNAFVRNCVCSCRQESQQLTQVDKIDSDELSLNQLLCVVEHYDQRQDNSCTAVSNLVRSYQANVILNQENVKKILIILDSKNHVVQEVMLVLIGDLCKSPANVKLLLEHDILDDLLYHMLMGSTEEIQIQAALCIAKLTEREELADLWMETMVISGTEALFDVLAAAEEETGDELRNAVMQCVVNLANNEKMAALLIGFGLEHVIGLTRCKAEEGKTFGSPTTRKLAIKALASILSHNSTMVEQFLLKYDDVIERVVDILLYCQCPEQREAARFLATLTVFKPSIDSILSHHAAQHILWSMTCSHCRFVREYSSQAFKNITINPDKDKLLRVLSEASPSQISPSGSSQGPSAASLTDPRTSTLIGTKTSQIMNAVKGQSLCTSLEKIMVDIFAVLTVCFQTDSLHLTGQSRTFTSERKPGGERSTINEKYLTSLKVLTNTLVAIETLIRLKDKGDDHEGDSSLETSANLSLATLFVQCIGQQFIDQLSFLSAKLQQVNPPSFHSIDPSTLPPREFVSTMKNARTQLLFQGARRRNTSIIYPDFGFHSIELQFIQQALHLVTLLSQATAPGFDPGLEDLRVFQYRRRVVGKKRHISFRSSAIIVKNMVQFGKPIKHAVSDAEEKPGVPSRKVSASRKVSSSNSSTQVSEGEEKPGRNRSASRKVTRRSARVVSSMNNIGSTNQLIQHVVPSVELGSSSKREMIHYLKESLLNSHLISHLAAWITCGVSDIQVSVMHILRYLIHVSHVPNIQSTDAQSSHGKPQEAWSPRRPTRTSTGSQRSHPSNSNSIPKSKSKSTHLGHVCVRHVVQYCGTYLLDLLKPPASKALGQMSLKVIREGVSNGENDSRFKLAKLGCFAQIIDFIRAVEDEPEMQGLGLVVVRGLVSSDQSLKQLFVAHGGVSLVMALHEYQQGLVKDEAAFTLATFSKASSSSAKTRASGISKKRQRKSSSDKTIWDHVTQKWQDQDKVAKLLKTFNVKY